MPVWFEPVIFATFGLIVGSFLNVVVIRHNTGRSLAGRSGCLSCGSPLEAYMLVPVLSWVLQRRRCVNCGTRISSQYPLVELATAAVFVTVGLSQLSYFHMSLALVIGALSIAIVAYDIRHTIMPDRWVYAAAALAFVYSMSATITTELPVHDSLIFALAGPMLAVPFVFIWYATRGRGMGLGDAKFALVIGWLLGPLDGLYAVMFAFILGAFTAVFVLMPLPYYAKALSAWGILKKGTAKTFTMKSEVPFGPFLVAGMLLVWFSQLYGVKYQLLTLGGFL